MGLLNIGCLDKGCIADPGAFVAGYHDWNLPKKGFRGETNGKWRKFRSLDGVPVRELQQKLRLVGFYPNGTIDGVYGYRTQSAVRLFQEYVRVIDGDEAIGNVDGLAGNSTQGHIDRWVQRKRRPEWRLHSKEHQEAIDGLKKLQDSFRRSTLKGIKLLNDKAAGSSSRAVADWTYDPRSIHLVGIRRNVNKIVAGRRQNDDLFILLVDGMRMVFRGSTNPDPKVGDRKNKAFLLRGQHVYRFGWHKIASTESNPRETKVYRGFKPRIWQGPLVVRGEGGLLTENSYKEAKPNPAINIHWSGAGTRNWSAGCQVIAGRKYIDYRNELVDLTDRASSGYADLSGAKTRGAYNVLIDAMTIAAEDIRTSGDPILYTLLYEEDVKRTRAGELVDFDETIRRLT